MIFWRRHRGVLEPLAYSLLALILGAAYVLPAWLNPASGLHFENPWFLLGFLLVPFVAAAGVHRRNSGARMMFSVARILGKQPGGWRVRLIPMQTGLRVAVVAFLVLALARPRDANEKSSASVEGIDIVLTLDLSGSMLARDMNPSRVAAAKEVVLDFIKRRKNDRIGAVVFAQSAYTLSPLTLDYTVLSKMISQLQVGVIDDTGTAIGNAVGVSINRLRKSEAKSKTIILVTDGASTDGNITPEQSAEFARTLGIKVYTILVGRNEDRSAINPELLKMISNETGAEFFTAQDKHELMSSFHTILDALERTKIEDQGTTYADVFYLYLWPALLLALLDMILGVVVIRRTP